MYKDSFCCMNKFDYKLLIGILDDVESLTPVEYIYMYTYSHIHSHLAFKA